MGSGFPCPSSNGDSSASQVPGDPLCACPALRPRRAGALGYPAHRCCLPVTRDCRPLKTTLEPGWPKQARFRGSVTRPTHSLPTLRFDRSPGLAARLGSRRSPSLPGRASHPLGPSAEFQRDVTSWHSLRPGFAWRTSCSCSCSTFFSLSRGPAVVRDSISSLPADRSGPRRRAWRTTGPRPGGAASSRSRRGAASGS